MFTLNSYLCYHLMVFYSFGVVFKYIVFIVSTSTFVLIIYAKIVPKCKPIIHMENNLNLIVNITSSSYVMVF
jgi:hypothetical protein